MMLNWTEMNLIDSTPCNKKNSWNEILLPSTLRWHAIRWRKQEKPVPKLWAPAALNFIATVRLGALTDDLVISPQSADEVIHFWPNETRQLNWSSERNQYTEVYMGRELESINYSNFHRNLKASLQVKISFKVHRTPIFLNVFSFP